MSFRQPSPKKDEDGILHTVSYEVIKLAVQQDIMLFAVVKGSVLSALQRKSHFQLSSFC
jgi:hypothetical protein